MQEWTSLLKAGMSGAAIVVALIAAGCGGGELSSDGGSSSSDAASSELNIRIPEDPSNLDPHLVQSTVGLEVAGYMYDTLIGRTSDGKLVPRLASEWTATPTSVMLTIRDDITCSDGSRLLPSDIAANFERLKDPETQSPYVSNFLGGTEFEVAADDAAGTVTIDVPRAFGALEFNLSGFPRIICRAGLDDPGRLQRESLGTGPFVLGEKVAGDHYTLAAREGYDWGPAGATTSAAGFPTAVVLRVVPNETTAANQLQTGELDIASVEGPERERLAGGELTSKNASFGVTGLFFNEAEGRPTADPAVREGLARALDRGALTQAGFGQFGDVANSFLLPTAPCYDPAAGSTIGAYDPVAAQRLLDAKSLSLKVYAIAVPGNEYVTETWNALGVETELNAGDESGPGLDVVFGGGDWDVALFSLDGINQLGVISPFFSGAPPPDGLNVGSIDNPGFADAATRSNAEVGAAACPLATEAQQSLYGAYDAVPLSVPSLGFFARKPVEFSLVGVGIDPTSLRAGS